MIATLALAAAVTATCNWGDRGLDPFMGDLPSAVDTYTQIPEATREALKAKMRARQYDDTAHITGAGIKSATWKYGPLRMMHFGNGTRLCGVVNTSMWPAGDPGERALIYTVGDWSIAVPSVCRNVSLIARGERITPPSPMRIATPPAAVDPLPVVADAPVPPVEPGPLADALPSQSFAQQTVPPYSPPPADEYPDRISADQTWVEYRSWRLLPPVASYFALTDTTLPVLSGSSAVGPFVPVPGITPTSAIPEPAPVQPAPVKPVTPDGAPVPSALPVPEPGTWALMMLGLGWVTWQRRKV